MGAVERFGPTNERVRLARTVLISRGRSVEQAVFKAMTESLYSWSCVRLSTAGRRTCCFMCRCRCSLPRCGRRRGEQGRERGVRSESEVELRQFDQKVNILRELHKRKKTLVSESLPETREIGLRWSENYHGINPEQLASVDGWRTLSKSVNPRW